MDFTDEDAHHAAYLWDESKVLGLSLVDRVCLATALRLNTGDITSQHKLGAVKNRD